jgi:membrane protein YqaA with SNARE-associated domain
MSMTWTLALVAVAAFVVGSVAGPLLGLWIDLQVTRRRAKADRFAPAPPAQKRRGSPRGDA